MATLRMKESDTKLYIKAYGNQFVGLEEQGKEIRLVSVSPIPCNMFEIVEKDDDANRIRIKAPNGNFCQAKTTNLVSADCGHYSEWGDDDPSVFLISDVASNIAATNDIIKMDTEVYRAAARGNIEFLKTHFNESDIGSFRSMAVKNTILHIFIIAQSKRKETSLSNYEKVWLNIELRFGLEMNNSSYISKKKTISPALSAETLERFRCMLDMWPRLLCEANEAGETPLHTAAKHGLAEIVKLVLESSAKCTNIGSDVERGTTVCNMLHMTSVDNETPLHLAVRYQHYDVVRVLIAHDDPAFCYLSNVEGETPLYMAAERDEAELVKIILDHYASPSYQGPDGRTALHAAALHSLAAAEVIMKNKGLEFFSTKVDDRGRTPLHYNASLLKYDKSAAFIVDNDGKTALHVVASGGKKLERKMMNEFIEECPQCFDVVDFGGRNALHCAMESGNGAMVDIILGSKLLGELVKKKDNIGNTPLHLLSAAVPNCSMPSLFFMAQATHDSRFDKMAFNKQKLNPLDVLLTNPTLAEKQTPLERCMRRVGISEGKRVLMGSEKKNVNEIRNPSSVAAATRSKELGDHDEAKQARQDHLVVAALIATVTFAAGFTMPGGYVQEQGPDIGQAVLARRSAFIAFVITNTIAMMYSCGAVFIHLIVAIYKGNKKTKRLIDKVAPYTATALIAMIVAFITGASPFCPILGRLPLLIVSSNVTNSSDLFL